MGFCQRMSGSIEGGGGVRARLARGVAKRSDMIIGWFTDSASIPKRRNAKSSPAS